MGATTTTERKHMKDQKKMRFASFTLTDPTASWIMGRISVYRNIQKRIDAGSLLLPAEGRDWNARFYKEQMRSDAKYMVKMYKNYLKS